MAGERFMLVLVCSVQSAPGVMWVKAEVAMSSSSGLQLQTPPPHQGCADKRFFSEVDGHFSFLHTWSSGLNRLLYLSD